MHASYAAAGLPPGHSMADHRDKKDGTDQVSLPVLAGGESWRLATAGGDNNVRIWRIHPNIPSPAALAAASSTTTAVHPPRAEYAATLARHTGVVNVVRFSPHGDLLASAGDDGNVLFWVQSDHTRHAFGDSHFSGDDGAQQHDKETWRVRLMTRATPLELYDVAWSPTGELLAAGGTDFAVRLINVADGAVLREISEHQHYVQGVAWDPRQKYLATQSSDRSVHLYQVDHDVAKAHVHTQLVSRQNRSQLQARRTDEAQVEKAATLENRSPPQRKTDFTALPTIRAPPSPKERFDASGALGETVQKIYGDDRCSSFFRRLCFSPDGALLATPTGQFMASTTPSEAAKSTSSHAVYLYGRANLARSHAPLAVLPGHKSTTVAVSFSPILYHLRLPDQSPSAAPAAKPLSEEEQKPESCSSVSPVSTFGLPYRMVYAVATQESVWVYDTQQAGPLCCFSNLHYASFTDLAWSPDGQSLMMSSSDGYCSIAVFDYHELGRPYDYEQQPSLKLSAPVKPVEMSVAHKIPTNMPPPGPSPMKSASVPTDAPASPAGAATDTPASGAAPKKKRRVALTFERPLPP